MQSHFTEIKYGLISGEAGTTDNLLRWDVSSTTHWSTNLVPGTWYNFAYDIDFGAGTVGLWASTGADALQQVIEPISASTSTNSEDWHIGELRLPNGGTNAAPEDWFWSGVFIEEGPITTDIAGPFPGQGGAAGSVPPPPPVQSSTAAPTSTIVSPPAPTSTTASASGPLQTQWGQCGGTGFTCVFQYYIRPSYAKKRVSAVRQRVLQDLNVLPCLLRTTTSASESNDKFSLNLNLIHAISNVVSNPNSRKHELQ